MSNKQQLQWSEKFMYLYQLEEHLAGKNEDKAAKSNRPYDMLLSDMYFINKFSSSEKKNLVYYVADQVVCKHIQILVALFPTTVFKIWCTKACDCLKLLAPTMKDQKQRRMCHVFESRDGAPIELESSRNKNMCLLLINNENLGQDGVCRNMKLKRQRKWINLIKPDAASLPFAFPPSKSYGYLCGDHWIKPNGETRLFVAQNTGSKQYDAEEWNEMWRRHEAMAKNLQEGFRVHWEREIVSQYLHSLKRKVIKEPEIQKFLLLLESSVITHSCCPPKLTHAAVEDKKQSICQESQNCLIEVAMEQEESEEPPWMSQSVKRMKRRKHKSFEEEHDDDDDERNYERRKYCPIPKKIKIVPSKFPDQIIRASKLLGHHLCVNYELFDIVPESCYMSLMPYQVPSVSTVLLELAKKVAAPKSPNILDMTAHIGCETANLLRLFPSSHLTAIEIDSSVFKLLVSNIQNIFPDITSRNVEFKKGDSLHLCSEWAKEHAKGLHTENKFLFDIVCVDPPWGGKAYGAQQRLDLVLSEKNLMDIILDLSTKHFSKSFVFKAPFNFNFKSLASLFSAGGPVETCEVTGVFRKHVDSSTKYHVTMNRKNASSVFASSSLLWPERDVYFYVVVITVQL